MQVRIPFLGNPLRPVLECLSFTLAFTFVGDSGALLTRSLPFKPRALPLLFALRLTRLAISVWSVISLTPPKRTTVVFSVACSCCPLLSSNTFTMAGWNSIANYTVFDRRKGLLNVDFQLLNKAASGHSSTSWLQQFKRKRNAFLEFYHSS